MNAVIKKIILFVAAIVYSINGYADSPLTSTDFYKAYLDVPIVKIAANPPHKLTEEMMAYLSDDANPLDVRLALVWCQMKLLLNDWDNIYSSFQYLFDEAQMKDMRPEARKIIMEYMDLYYIDEAVPVN